MSITYGSVCSGIEAASVAWERLGWQPSFFAEIDKFPSAVLSHHFQTVPNAGDFTQIQRGHYDEIDLLVGGTPCQDFSVGGPRAGWSGKRGTLSWAYVNLVRLLRPDWFVWENVLGAITGKMWRGFLQFISALSQVGYGVAWRCFDARYFGLAQRRPRIFACGRLGGISSGKVLLESKGVQGVDSSIEPPAVSVCLTARGAGSIDDRETYVVDDCGVRHMTPLECERLQGFPDNWTRIPWRGKGPEKCPDGPRYKALGNSMAVNCMRWIGQRIQVVDGLC